ncbi:unnamed protein product [Rotaria magnacalcarata]|uniref:Uncharacterized protein n=3 Tax=Rotaria magnacalcarata TaxID=392030 RepID=A0A819Z6J1_9BILA|nr:unnamed protein product [Rotaria magnacalcarata]CAF4167467.1 unnamed protein product [Rotaria magnacalcarata]
MTLLEDPTIQRILDEVNKAASGGIFGMAGNYVSKPRETMTPFESKLLSSENSIFNQNQAPLFYTTPEMLGMKELKSFDGSINLNSIPSMVPVAKSTSFDFYSSGYYNTTPSNLLSPYANCNGITQLNIKNQLLNNNPTRSRSNASSTNNDILLERHHHHHSQQYHSIPSTNLPNLGLNIRVTPQSDKVPIENINLNELQLTSEQMPVAAIKNVSTSTRSSLADKEERNSFKLNNSNDDIDRDDLNSPGQIFYDPNPQIIQRKGSHSVTYKQNIIVRFLQPPSIPNAGPLIIKEVRPPQTSPLPPLVIKQRPTPPKTPPPLIIREKPPPLPSCVATKVITRQLPPEPAPPRAVIIERLPPLPSKPRDIIIERWLPYEILDRKRKVIVQRAPKSTKEHLPPKNIIITYEPVHAKIVRNFQKQDVIREDPQAYAKRYGSQLCDYNLVIQQARAAGILEDLNPTGSSVSTMSDNGHTTTTDYQMPTTMPEDEHQQEQNTIENNEKPEENNEHTAELHDDEPKIEAPSLSTVHIDEHDQDEDILVEENVTPFYMNSGEDLQQTLHRLGIDMPQNRTHENNF